MNPIMDVPLIGERIELLEMPDDPNPLPVGSRGTVRSVTRHGVKGETQPYMYGEIRVWFQVDVAWDSGRTLMLSMPPDRVRILKKDDARVPFGDGPRWEARVCDCVHDADVHDPVSKACFYTTPTFGPCPCAATPEPTRAALKAAHLSLREALRDLLPS